VPPPASLLGLNASHTGPLECRRVEVGRQWLLEGPMENVIAGRSGTKTGGLQTSALAAGLSAAAVQFLENEAQNRPALIDAARGLHGEQQLLEIDLLSLAAGTPACSSDEVRA